MKTVNPTIEFLDDVCSVDRYDKGWNLIRTVNFGYWVYRDEPEKVLYKILSSKVDEWEAEKGISQLPYNGPTTAQVRNICGTKFGMIYPDSFNVPFWINVVYPKTNPLDMRTVRVEAYTDGSQAYKDAVEERKDVKNRVFTKKLETDILDTTDYLVEESLVASDHRGLIETEVVKEYIDENVYLRKTMRDMLKLIPKDKVLEFNEKLTIKIQDAVEKDTIEEEYEETFAYIGRLIDKAFDIFKKARPPIESLSSNNSYTAMDKDLWYGKRDTILNQLMNYSTKKQPATYGFIRDNTKKDKL